MTPPLPLVLALFAAAPGARPLPTPQGVLARAAAEGNVVELQRLLDAGQALEQKDAQEWTALHWAAVYGQLEAAGMLLDRGADPSPRGQLDMTPLHLASMLGRPEMAGLLLRRGARIAAKNVYGMTPLHEAADAKTAEALLAAGAPLEDKDDRGWTPLHAARNGRVAKELLDKGADIMAKAVDGRMPVQRWVLDQLEPQGLLIYSEHRALRLRGESALGEFGVRNVSAAPLKALHFTASCQPAGISVVPAELEALAPGQWTTLRLGISRKPDVPEGEYPVKIAIVSAGQELGSVDLELNNSRGETPEDQGMIRLGKGSIRPAPSNWQYLAYAGVPVVVLLGWVLVRRRR